MSEWESINVQTNAQANVDEQDGIISSDKDFEETIEDIKEDVEEE